MSQRYTRKDVEAVFATFVEVSRRAGFDVEGWFVVIGSKTMGNTFEHRTHKGPDGVISSGWSSPPFRTFLGWTCREAYDTLSTRIDTLSALHYVQSQNKTT